MVSYVMIRLLFILPLITCPHSHYIWAHHIQRVGELKLIFALSNIGGYIMKRTEKYLFISELCANNGMCNTVLQVLVIFPQKHQQAKVLMLSGEMRWEVDFGLP